MTPIALGAAAVTTNLTHGVLTLSNNGTDDDSGMQGQATNECFALVTGKECKFTVRVRTSDATQTSWFFGLSITDTTIQHATTDTLAGGLTPTDAVGFYKPDGEATFYLVIIRDSVQVSTGTLGTMSDSTFLTLSFRVMMDASTAGKGSVYAYVNGAVTPDQGTALSSTTMPYESEEYLAPSFSWKSCEAAANTCDIDRIGVALER